ncbi:hypothetical protein E3E31_02720 [Thermococcus sp. M39]|uniref:hypothetical protein n=1 Tax=unclassified Thermococcus TaxID=2627626 RepID=UPI00143C3D43|nr:MULTISPECIES: hypothetical protein [unclassified Thermococcus]NJE07456.1 hypothetical protein [Thermococcus sp. M39]NJE12412.1 hypothetical protein [Thermococcus sp. LS2]
MNKRLLALVLVLVLVAAPLAVAFYGYSSYTKAVEPQKKPLAVKPVAVPFNGRTYPILLESYLTGDPLVDINMTLRSPYERATIILGDPSFKNCEGSEACVWRVRTVSELGTTIGAVFGVKYYIEELKKTKSNQSAKYKAFEETTERIDKRYLAFMPKVEIGLGLIGNKKHLLVVLKGPREGAEKNRIYCPKPGVIVLEGTTEDTLFVEVLLIKTIISSQVK